MFFKKFLLEVIPNIKYIKGNYRISDIIMTV